MIGITCTPFLTVHLGPNRVNGFAVREGHWGFDVRLLRLVMTVTRDYSLNKARGDRVRKVRGRRCMTSSVIQRLGSLGILVSCHHYKGVKNLLAGPRATSRLL